MASEPTRRPFTVTDYYRMAETGVLDPSERVELIEGEVIRMNPIGPTHANCVDRLNRDLVTALGDRATVRIQNPVRLSELSEPEPDVAVIRPDRDLSRHPGPTDVLLIVEVADSSIGFDRRVKLPLYASAGIPEVWIVDLATRAVEIHSQSGSTGYAVSERHQTGSTLQVPGFPDVGLSVDAILGP